MQFLTSTLCIISSLSLLAAAQPIVQQPATSAMTTAASSASTIQRPIVKSTLQTSALPNTAISGDTLAQLSDSNIQAQGKCGPVCTRFSPSGTCLEMIDGCSHGHVDAHKPHHSGLSKLNPKDRILAILAGGVTAGMVDWRLGVLMLFAAGLPERVVWGVQAAPVGGKGLVEATTTTVTGEESQTGIEADEPDCRLVCTFTDPRHICQKYVCDCSGNWKRGEGEDQVMGTRTGVAGFEKRQWVKCTPTPTPVPSPTAV
ncbi:hypothetical protein CB0940_05886 [Cercospora beticola]|uniref:Uncharacterized protein n=1 Tax=Cercospora beticola TaxID=122368 RepID=A0A2G5HY67_CERBT|nr:hypothetical protein CB0940_05886 [Cercospora beticola]PIA97192.1 hypothetical protein CB0940_05886 [Cercospora beticola]WPA98480.1 hypothetical protein RHO25_003092 [Cercospora beticola]CAK1359733.1 unnamed protein product [Cercospora beticola]